MQIVTDLGNSEVGSDDSKYYGRKVSFWLHGCCGELRQVWPLNWLATPVGWLHLLQLTVLSRSTIAV